MNDNEKIRGTFWVTCSVMVIFLLAGGMLLYFFYYYGLPFLINS